MRDAAEIVRHLGAVERERGHVHSADALENQQGAVEILHAAPEGGGDQQVVRDLWVLLGVLRAERVFPPGDGLLEIAIGVRELPRGGADRSEALQDVVAQWIVFGRLPGEFPGAGEEREGGFIIALQICGVAGFEEQRNVGGRIVLGRRAGGQKG